MDNQPQNSLTPTPNSQVPEQPSTSPVEPAAPAVDTYAAAEPTAQLAPEVSPSASTTTAQMSNPAPAPVVAPQATYTSPAPAATATRRKPLLLIAVILVVLIVGIGASAMAMHHKKPSAKVTATAQTKPVNSTSTAPSSTLSEQDKETAKINVRSLQANLEAYGADHNGIYPGEIDASNFPDADPSIYKAPAGTKLVYTPRPANCTTAAKNCKGYTLESIAIADGSVIEHVSNAF